MKRTVFQRIRSLLLAVICLAALAVPFAAFAETYTMVVDGDSYSLDGTTGPVRFGTDRELGTIPGEADAAFRVMLAPGAFKLKSGSTVISDELYSLELQDSLTFYNSVQNGSVVFSAGQVVWCKDTATSGDYWNIGKPYSSAWTTAGSKSAGTAYPGVEKTESKEARCCFTFKDSTGKSIAVEGKLSLSDKCKWDDCHLLTASGSVDIKVAHVITLDQQGATTDGTKSVKAAKDSDLPEITVPEKTDFFFQGFYSEAEGKGTKYYDNTGKGVKKWDKDADTTLYAYWSASPAPAPTPVPAPVPKTGDNNSPLLFAALLVLSAAALPVLLRKKNRE